MLRLWPSRLLVSLASTGVSWLRLGSAVKPRVLARRTIRLDSEFGAEPWQGAVEALRLEADSWRVSPASVTIVLSNHFVRYLVVPQNKGVSGIEEEFALARYHFARVYGEPSRAWDVRLSGAGTTGPRIACAIDPGLLKALHGCFPREKVSRLQSVQPLLMSAFNFWRRQFPSSGTWFLLVEAERACLALVTGQTWTSVQNVRGHYPDPEAWVTLLDRERWRTNMEHVPDTVLVHAPQLPAARMAGLRGWKLLGLQTPPFKGLSAIEQSEYAAALTAA